MINNLLSVENTETKDGIRIFSEDRYWGKAPKEELVRALDLIDKKGWPAFYDAYRGKFDFTAEENRADWRFNIPVDKNFTILDIGAGMGRITIPLARVAKEVIACDTSFLRMKFLKNLSEKEGLSNVDVCVGDIFNLPFKKESFDLIVMNGLLEWVGKTDLYSDPRQAQIESLKICKGLLKKGGYLYVGIENRFALSYLRGIDHSGLRYTSYMPRWMANLYTKLRKGESYDTYTYGASGYGKLFHEAGFASPDFYLVYPGYNLPRITIPYENLNMLRYVIKILMPGNSMKRKIAKKLSGIYPLLWIYRKLFFSFNIIAQK